MSQHHITRLILSIALYAAATASTATQDVLPLFQCTLTNHGRVNNDRGVTHKTFSSGSSQVFLICDSDTVRKGDSIRAAWIADDTNNPAWDNTLIKQSKRVVARNLNSLDLYKTIFTLERPCNGWPLGTYHVRLYINGIEGDDYSFTIR